MFRGVCRDPDYAQALCESNVIVRDGYQSKYDGTTITSFPMSILDLLCWHGLRCTYALPTQIEFFSRLPTQKHVFFDVSIIFIRFLLPGLEMIAQSMPATRPLDERNFVRSVARAQ